jgi:hypothetical protein
LKEVKSEVKNNFLPGSTAGIGSPMGKLQDLYLQSAPPPPMAGMVAGGIQAKKQEDGPLSWIGEKFSPNHIISTNGGNNLPKCAPPMN